MDNTKNIPLWANECAVTDCRSVEEFAYRYRKPERFTGRGEAYVQAILKRHKEAINERGYTCISKHDNVTGEFIVYIPLQVDRKSAETP